MKKLTFIGLFTLMVSVVLFTAEPNHFLKDYRSWFHVKTLILEEGHPLYASFGGIHHVYANSIALNAMKKGLKNFPNGSIFVFDLLEVEKANNAIAEGKRKVLAYMRKDSKRFKETGGWEFQGFAAGDYSKPVVKDASKDCFSCHTSQKDNDYVFSKIRE